MEIFNKESVYDEQISPLIRQIIAICNDHGIPMVSSFTFENCPDRGPGRCTTLINDIPNRNDDAFQQASAIIKCGGNRSFAIAIRQSTNNED